jgi:hypothetical protein
MAKKIDEIIHIHNNTVTFMPHRTMRDGIMGKTLEDALQTILENYPQIIPGKQIEPGNPEPPRFVLLRREMPVTGGSLDHLLVDQNGVLTLVETKLFQNIDSKREVIGQIIEYAANAAESWGGGKVKEKAFEYWSKKGKQIEEIISEEFGIDDKEFWDKVDNNLQEGNIRLIIATDELRPEMRRMVEFLNNEMRNTEILALELKFYGESSEDLVLVPSIIGQTQLALDKKNTTNTNVKWTVDLLREAYSEIEDKSLGLRMLKVLDWALKNNIFMQAIALKPTFGIQGKSKDRIFSFFSGGVLYCFLNEKHYPDGARERDEFVGQLKTLHLFETVFSPTTVTSGRSLLRKIPELSDDEFDQLLAIINQYCD